MNSAGLSILARESFDRGEDAFDRPLSRRFDEGDAILMFDKVLVPHERMIVDGDLEAYNGMLSARPGYTPLQATIRSTMKLRFLAGMATAIARANGRDKLPRFQDISPDQMRISPDDKWRTFVFYGFGYPSERNCGLCPETAQVLRRIPGLESALFSILAPGKHVPSHHGVSKGLIRCHLGLKVPRERERCVMDVGPVTRSWEEGRAL